MENTGKELEQLVETVEKMLLPAGFNVSTREKIYNDDGIQIAELDILVSGRLGSTHLNWLIECRDRPSEGAAPVSWIEQLVGRRTRFNFSKVTAVSTTGFAQPAVEFARVQGIELRSITNVTEDSISDWFRITTIDFINHKSALTHFSLHLSPTTNREILTRQENSRDNIDPATLILIHTGTGASLHILDAWHDAINQFPNIFDDIHPGESPMEKTVEINYVNPQSRYKLKLDDSELDVERITFTANLSIEISQIPFSQITKYINIFEGDTIADSVHFEIPAGFDLAIHKVTNQSNSYIAVTTSPPKKESK